MSENTYIIRNYLFGYNDEYRPVCGSEMYKVYRNNKKAEEAY